jgi:iron complex transport system permease protein
MKSYSSKHTLALTALAVLLLISFFLSISLGAIYISFGDIYQAVQNKFLSNDPLSLIQRIFFDIRLPRAVACLLVGASLSMSGVLMQALFRNPIVEPGLIGTSSGAAFGASLYFVFGSSLSFISSVWALPLAACFGGMISTTLVFILAQNKSRGKSAVVLLLLTGIAINAIFLSAVGFFSYLARDPQARSITFWNLGTMSGANWHSVLIMFISTSVCFLLARRFTKHLNALMMGEEEAYFIGVDLRKLKLLVITINVILVAVATAFVGVISFVGLVVPHLLRLRFGSDNRFLLMGSALLGGILVTLADLVARLALAPAELPIGIVTSVIGVPIFITILRKSNYYF